MADPAAKSPGPWWAVDPVANAVELVESLGLDPAELDENDLDGLPSWAASALRAAFGP